MMEQLYSQMKAYLVLEKNRMRSNWFCLVWLVWVRVDYFDENFENKFPEISQIWSLLSIVKLLKQTFVCYKSLCQNLNFLASVHLQNAFNYII